MTVDLESSATTAYDAAPAPKARYRAVSDGVAEGEIEADVAAALWQTGRVDRDSQAGLAEVSVPRMR